MFEAMRDQAAGLRQLFAPREALRLLAVGCATGDARGRAGAEAIAATLAAMGQRPLLIDLDGGARCVTDEQFESVDARAVLPAGADSRRFTRFVNALRMRAEPDAGDFDVVLVAGEALRVADLAAGLAERIVLVSPACPTALAHTYSQIKAMHLAHGYTQYCSAFVDAHSSASAAASHRRLARTALRFLGAAIEFGGVLHGDADPIDWTRFADPWPQTGLQTGSRIAVALRAAAATLRH